MKLLPIIALLFSTPAAFCANVNGSAAKNSITVTWQSDWAVRYITVCSKPGQYNPALVCQGANEDGDFRQQLNPPAGSGQAVLSGLKSNQWYTIKVKGIPHDGSVRKQIGVIKLKTLK